ncbi:MAG TPA: hypothetical protein VK157_09530 [Phycisphaerales bacterium]|nr:hypothetical protein [Phycisphaerales bacterium]
MKRTPANVLLIAAGNAAAVIVALAVLAWFTVGRERKKLEQQLASNEPITVIPFDMGSGDGTQPPLPLGQPPKIDLTPEPSPDAPAIVRELASFEQAGDYAAALQATLRDSASLNDAEREQLIAWLTTRKDSAAFPTLFMLARTHQDAGRSDDAAKWYMAGSLMGLIDAARFEDASAGDAVREIEAQFSDIRQRLRQDSALRVQAVTFALDIESQLAQRQAPVWIAARAQSAVAGEPAKLLSTEDWDAKRKAYRDLFAGFVERSGKMSVVELGWAFE